jgi:competence protein ComEC
MSSNNPSQRKKIMRSFLLSATALLLSSSFAIAVPDGLDIHFIDTEGGASTLIVTPAGESVLVDCGNPGSRDPERIFKAAQKAGLKQIDHLVITHWHSDHYGGVDRLTRLIPVKNFYDHGMSDSIPEVKEAPGLIQAYKDASAGKAKTLAAGDEIKLKQTEGRPALTLRCLCGDSKVIADKADAAENPVAKEHKPKPEDTSDNARSLGFLLRYGEFRFLDLGDLTWNIEYKLVHPTDKIGRVDVYQVTHHGLDISNNPVLINTVKPRVAICNNGPRKGAHVSVIATLRRVEGIEGIYQLHKNMTVGDAENTDPEFIANKDEKCQGDSIDLSTAADGKTYSVTVGGKTREYKVRGK